MGNVGEAMTSPIFYAFCYELALWLIQRSPQLRFNVWMQRLLDYCKPFWEQWKTEATLKQVDEQAQALKEQWERDERKHRADELAKKAQEMFPDATVSPLPDAPVPSVMIIREASPGASEAVKALGGELRITYRLEE